MIFAYLLPSRNCLFHLKSKMESVDWQHPSILELARKIAPEGQTAQAVVKACFEWVRDEIFHVGLSNIMRKARRRKIQNPKFFNPATSC